MNAEFVLLGWTKMTDILYHHNADITLQNLIILLTSDYSIMFIIISINDHPLLIVHCWFRKISSLSLDLTVYFVILYCRLVFSENLFFLLLFFSVLTPPFLMVLLLALWEPEFRTPFSLVGLTSWWYWTNTDAATEPPVCWSNRLCLLSPACLTLLQ